MEEDTQPLIIRVGSNGERTLTNEHAESISTSSLATSIKANTEGDLFQLERKRREVERRIREIESREAHLKGTVGRGKRGRTNESEGSAGAVANSEEPALSPKRRLLSSAVLPSQAAARLPHDGVEEEEGRGRKRARESRIQDRGLYEHADKRRAPDGDERIGRGERGAEQRLVPAKEGTERGRNEERERRQKEREEREKEWVKKAGGDATRNRRVFGVLLGTLQRFRKDQSAVAEKERVREQITKQVEEKVKEESELIVKEEERRLAEEKEKQQALREELAKQIEEIQLSTLQSQWAVHHKLVANFHKTKAKPHICYTFNDYPLGAADDEGHAVDSRRHRRDRDSNSGSDSESSNSDSDIDEPERDVEAKPTEQRGDEEDAGR